MKLFVFTLFLFASVGASYKILVYNIKMAHSHSSFLGRIADMLADAGHNVTSLIPVLDAKVADGTSKSRVVYVPTNEVAAEKMELMHKGLGVDFWEDDLTGLIGSFVQGQLFKSAFCAQCETTLDHPGLIEQLKADKYDVFIGETFDFCAPGLPHLLGIKSSITVTSTTIFDNVAYHQGIPVVPSFNPALGTDDLDIRSIWSRAKNVLKTHANHLAWGPSMNCANQLYKMKYGDDFPDISDLLANVAVIFTNSEPIIDFARPLLRKVVDLGAISMELPKPLDENWKNILSLRSKNVLVSFGSVAKSTHMKPERLQALLSMFARFPDVTFIWKYENPEDDFAKNEMKKLPHVVLSKWTPQNDLLNDPRMTAFVSHAGIASCYEAAARGVPGLFIPLFGDQPRNAAMMAANGIGLKLSKADAKDAEKLIATVDELLNSDRLRTNAKRISAMLAKRPFTQKELLIKHVEFAAEFGPAEALTPRGIQLGWIQYFLVDVIIMALAFTMLTAGMVALFLRVVFRKCFPGKTQEKPKRS